MGGKFWLNSIRLIFLSPNHPSLFTFVILINQCIKKINWSYTHRVSQRIYAHCTCYRFSKSPRSTARARIRTKRCIPVDIQYNSGDRTAVINRIQLLDVSYGCIRYISVVLIVSCVLLVVVSLQRPSRDKIFEYTVSLPSLPSIRNSIPLCQKVDSRILRKNTESLLTVYSGILTECLVYSWYTLEYFTRGTESLLTVYSGIQTECLVYGWYTLEYFRKSAESLPMVYFQFTPHMAQFNLVPKLLAVIIL